MRAPLRIAGASVTHAVTNSPAIQAALPCASPPIGARVQIHSDVVQFGGADDDDLGDLLLDRLLAGTLRVIVEPAELLDPEERAAVEASPGGYLTVIDGDGEPVCNVRVERVLHATWGEPDPVIIAGEGYGSDVEAWRRATGPVLGRALEEAGSGLREDTELVAQEVTVVETADHRSGGARR